MVVLSNFNRERRYWKMTDSCVTECIIEGKISKFVNAVNEDKRFEIAGLDKDDSVFVLRDTTKTDGEYASYIEVPIDQILKDEKNTGQIFDVLYGRRKDTVLNGVTRIVGYYSRMSNWNKSKIGELRDRYGANYALSGRTPEFDNARLSYINNL